MRHLMTTAVLSIAVSAGAALPASASDTMRESVSRERSALRMHDAERGERRARQRLAYFVQRESFDDDEVRPRRQHRLHAATHGKRASRSRHRRAHSALHRRGHRIARRATSHRRAGVHGLPRRAAPAWSRKSLGNVGPRHSGQQGVASYYWQPQRVAAGGWFNPNGMTAAHRSLPFGTRVRVTHHSSGRSVDVTINDRGPYIAGRIIDLSRAAAGVIGMTAQGIARVTVEVLGR